MRLFCIIQLKPLTHLEYLKLACTCIAAKGVPGHSSPPAHAKKFFLVLEQLWDGYPLILCGFPGKEKKIRQKKYHTTPIMKQNNELRRNLAKRIHFLELARRIVVSNLCFDACFSQLEPKPPSGGQTKMLWFGGR
jgi:hypothetical protein